MGKIAAAPFVASELNGVQAKIKEKLPEAMFAHKLNLVLLHPATSMPMCCVFLFLFLSNQQSALTCWMMSSSAVYHEQQSRLVQTISMHHIDLRALFGMIFRKSRQVG